MNTYVDCYINHADIPEAGLENAARHTKQLG